MIFFLILNIRDHALSCFGMKMKPTNAYKITPLFLNCGTIDSALQYVHETLVIHSYNKTNEMH